MALTCADGPLSRGKSCKRSRSCDGVVMSDSACKVLRLVSNEDRFQENLRKSASVVFPIAVVRRVVVSGSIEQDNRSTVPSGFHPHDFLTRILEKRGITVSALSYDKLTGFFVQPTPEGIASYTSDLINAVRSSDLKQLRQYHSDGKMLQCSNRFGESLLHLACRKQLIPVVDFLINEAGVSVQITDDFGRTPLSDSCWTPTPNFELVDLILKKCPDLLYIMDKRGHTPLFYARREHWSKWISHLCNRAEELTPRQLSFAGTLEQMDQPFVQSSKRTNAATAELRGVRERAHMSLSD